MHSRYIALGLLLLFGLLQTGCATLSKSECRAADWYDIGIRDGASGRHEEYIIEHATACERVGVAIDQQEPCPFLGEPDRGRPPVADRLASLLAGAYDHCDLLVQASAHDVLSP